MLSAFEYIKYLLASRKRHRVHSPFLYEFTDKCFKINYTIEDGKKNLLFKHQNIKSAETITITDYGAGSKYMNSQRRVKDIFKKSSSKGKYGKLLYQISKYYNPKNILELGTSLGNGTVQLALGNPLAHVTTIEGCPETAKISKRNFENLAVKNIELLNITFDDYFEQESKKVFDLVFIDGHHDGEALKKYLVALEPLIHKDTILILDDIRWSNSMITAWNDIVSSANYCVTIDLFRVGIIVKRPQQYKEHFVIRM